MGLKVLVSVLVYVSLTSKLTFGVMGQIPDTARLRGLFDGVTRSEEVQFRGRFWVKIADLDLHYDWIWRHRF